MRCERGRNCRAKFGDSETDEVFIAEFSSSEDENFAFAQRFIAVCVGILLVCSMVYLGSI